MNHEISSSDCNAVKSEEEMKNANGGRNIDYQINRISVIQFIYTNRLFYVFYLRLHFLLFLTRKKTSLKTYVAHAFVADKPFGMDIWTAAGKDWWQTRLMWCARYFSFPWIFVFFFFFASFLEKWANFSNHCGIQLRDRISITGVVRSFITHINFKRK